MALPNDQRATHYFQKLPLMRENILNALPGQQVLIHPPITV